jgi:hypothetical protein
VPPERGPSNDDPLAETVERVSYASIKPRVAPDAPPARPLAHHCEVCGEYAMFGIGVRLLEGREGTWFCQIHRPRP